VCVGLKVAFAQIEIVGLMIAPRSFFNGQNGSAESADKSEQPRRPLGPDVVVRGASQPPGGSEARRLHSYAQDRQETMAGGLASQSS
jgi:hypothetical protein